MKLTVTLLSSFIVGSLGLGVPFASVSPIPAGIQKNYNLSWDGLNKICNTKGTSLFKEIIAINSDSGQTTFQVAYGIFDEVEKKSNVTKQDWNSLIQEKCFLNPTFKQISKSVIDKVQNCVDKKNQLSQKKKLEAQDDLLKLICQDVLALAQYDYYPLWAKKPENLGK